MLKIHERLFIGGLDACNSVGMAVVHACKHPCHAQRCGAKPDKLDPDYLVHEHGGHLYLNIIDPDIPLFKLEQFTHTLQWIRDRWSAGESVLIHCNKGQSRAPSIAMLVMAKVIGAWPDDHAEAAGMMDSLMGGFNPGRGIATFLAEEWSKIQRYPYDGHPEDTSRIPQETEVSVADVVAKKEPDPWEAAFDQVAEELTGTPPGFGDMEAAQERIENDGYSLAEIDEIADNPEMWARLHGFTPDRVTQQPVRLMPSPLQRRLFTHYRRCQMTCVEHRRIDCDCPLSARGVPVRVVMCKVRRGGGSTGAEALLYVHAHNYKARLGAIGTTHTVSMNMFEMIRFFDEHDSFEHWQRASKVLEIGYAEWPNGSTWERYTADNPESARSAGLQGYHATEVGRWQNGGKQDAWETLKSMLGAVPKQGFTVAIEESTAQGAAGAFYERWMSARWPEYADWWKPWESDFPQQIEEVAADMQFVRIFSGWFEDEENAIRVITEEQVKYLERTLDDKERRLIERYGNKGPQGQRLGTGVTKATVWQQLAWRRGVIKSEFDGDVEGFEQEYPSGPKEAFASSGRHTFNSEGCAWMRMMSKHMPPKKGILVETHDGRIVFNPTDDSEAYIHLWEPPKVGMRYVQAVDTMTGEEQTKGSKTHDYHAAGIIRAAYIDGDGAKCPHLLVATIRPKQSCEIDVLARQTDMLHRWYGRCLTAPEVNNSGYAYVNEARRLNINLYEREKIDRFTSESTNIIGWYTDPKTRPALIASLQALIRRNANESTRADGIEVFCEETAQQLSTMVKGADGKDAAAHGCNDDQVMMLGIAVQVLDGATYYAGERRRRRRPADHDQWRRVSAE